MLDLATGLIERTLAKLIGRGIDISTKTVGQKRSLLSSVLGLYEALAELETASWRTYKTFARWAEEKGRATKVVLKARLQAIREATDKYDKYLQESGRALEIYDRDLTLILRGTGSPKRANIARLALMISALPDQALDGERLTTRVYYPSGLPDISDIQTNYHISTTQNLRTKPRRSRGFLPNAFTSVCSTSTIRSNSQRH